jgi:hypothetical protein
MIRFRDQELPIFFCSGAVTEGDKRSRLKPVRKAIFEKPFDPDELPTTKRAAVNSQPT